MSESTTPLDELLAHSGWLSALARRLVGEAGAAEDLVQEVYLRATERPPGTVRSQRGWLSAVMRSIHTRRMDKRSARSAREREVARPEALPSVAEVSERAEAQRLLVDAVLAMDEKSRHVILLHYFEGLELVEVARRSGVPDSTVRSRLARALTKLRAELDARSGGRASWLTGLCLLAAPERAAAPVPMFAMGSALMGKFIAVGSAVLIVVFAFVWFGQERSADGLDAPAEVVQRSGNEAEAQTTKDVASLLGSEREELASIDSESRSATPVQEPSAKLRSVSGVVFDPDGSPLAGAEVYEGTAREVERSLRRSGEARRPSIRTDENGAYRLEFAANDRREGALLSARAEGFAPSEIRHVELVRASDVSGADLILRAGATLEGLVFGPDDRLVAGRDVIVVAVDHGEQRQVESDEEGSFRLTALRPGRWQVSTFPDASELDAVGRERGSAIQVQVTVELVVGVTPID